MSTMAELGMFIMLKEVEESITSVYQITQSMEDIEPGYKVTLLSMEWSMKHLVVVLFLHFINTMSHVLSAMSPPGQLY